MQFITALLGGPENTWLNAGFALGIVLVLIVMAVWVLKLFTRATTSVGRGRNRRLGVIDQVMVDSRRQLMIVRRDNVEHLILTGGPQDLLVESGFTAPEPQPVRRPVSRAGARTAEPAIGDEAPPVSTDPAPRQSGPQRPISGQQPGLIPMGPALRVDNVGGPAIDSAKTGSINGTSGTRLGSGRNRFFRSITRSDQP